jgi:hypothetical protein
MRLVNCREVLLAGSVVLGLGACHAALGTSATNEAASNPEHSAMSICRDALPGEHVVSATQTTVRSVRAWGYMGPVQRHPLRNAFAGAAGDERAVWCWTRDGPRTVNAYAAHPRYGAVHAITIEGPQRGTPHGSPNVP